MAADADHYGDVPSYANDEEIVGNELAGALQKLALLDDDPFLRMQALNLSTVDKFIVGLEYEILRKQFDEERLPLAAILFLSAQTQMWIFAAYELLRTWRERVKDIKKWHENGGLLLKAKELGKEKGYLHLGRKQMEKRLRMIAKNPASITPMLDDLKRTHMLFARIEFIRVVLAKHQEPGKRKVAAHAAGYARINKWCGSLEYQMELNGVVLGTISRRDIADALRVLHHRPDVPTDDDIAEFDRFMTAPLNENWPPNTGGI